MAGPHQGRGDQGAIARPHVGVRVASEPDDVRVVGRGDRAVMVDLRADDEQALVVTLADQRRQGVETTLFLAYPQAPVVARPTQQLSWGLVAHDAVDGGHLAEGPA